MVLDRSGARRQLAYRALLFAFTVIVGGEHVAQVAARPSAGGVSWDVRREAEWVDRAMSDHGRLAQRFFPEGELFQHEFYALAMANIAEITRDADDARRAVRTLRAMLAAMESMPDRAPLKPMARWELRGGIMWFGGQNLLRARLLQLASDATPEEVARFHRDSATLARLYAASPAGLLDSYPGHTWPVDNLFGYRSLALHDALYGTHYGAEFARLRGELERGQDRKTHLAPSAVSLTGEVQDVPRGCALSWSLAVLPGIDADYARAQWDAYRAHFFRCAGGLCLVREYPPGIDRPMDPDSGPIIGGLGMAASGFALAAARANGDLQTATALQRTGELLGAPTIGWWGKRYWGGEVTFFDVLALWSKTIPLPADARGTAPRLTAALALLAAAWLLLAVLQVPGLRSARRELASANGEARVQQALELLTWALLAAHLVLPGLRLGTVVFAWALLDVLSRLLANLARGRSAPVPSAACVSSASSSQP